MHTYGSATLYALPVVERYPLHLTDLQIRCIDPDARVVGQGTAYAIDPSDQS